MRFMGTSTPKLDEKGRLFLPAKYRESLSEGVVVSRGQEHCLVVWPPEVFDLQADEARAMPQSSRAARSFSRMLFSASEEVVPDKQGRIGLAGVLRDYASLEKEVVVIGNGNRLEIWNPDKWAEYQAEEARRFAELDDDESEA